MAGDVDDPSVLSARLPDRRRDRHPFGVVIALSPVVARLSGFYVRLLLTMPMSSVVPIAIALLGLGLGSRVALVVLFVVGVVTVNTATGLRSASPQLTEMARSFYASPTLTFLRVRLPAAIPSIMAGLRTELAAVWWAWSLPN
ncbi:MAG: ABC transporter permease subunit [Acidimicrobiia bacterium]|nr:ABC transporter permease subunit [Acidimicrobiia bacterium]